MTSACAVWLLEAHALGASDRLLHGREKRLVWHLARGQDRLARIALELCDGPRASELRARMLRQARKGDDALAELRAGLAAGGDEAARDLAREIRETDAYVTSFIQRRRVEMLFAHLKRYIGVSMMRLRGPNGAREQFQLAATAQNLRKLAKMVPNPA